MTTNNTTKNNTNNTTNKKVTGEGSRLCREVRTNWRGKEGQDSNRRQQRHSFTYWGSVCPSQWSNKKALTPRPVLCPVDSSIPNGYSQQPGLNRRGEQKAAWSKNPLNQSKCRPEWLVVLLLLLSGTPSSCDLIPTSRKEKGDGDGTSLILSFSHATNLFAAKKVFPCNANNCSSQTAWMIVMQTD